MSKSRKVRSRKGKYRHRKSKHTKRHLSHKRRSRKMKGGYGKGACPFIGPAWTPQNGGNYYLHNKNGIGVGGLDPYIGNVSPAPQNTFQNGGTRRRNRRGGYRQNGGSGGLWQQLVLNPYRGAVGGLGNLYNTYAGRSLTPSPYPQYQNQLLPQTSHPRDVYIN